MTCVALLMSIFKSKPSPFCILDEVDAPLDEANIRRFSTFLSRLAKHGTQFVLITHQKATFEVADTLWGITTERGVSRVFSVRRSDEAEPATADAASRAQQRSEGPEAALDELELQAASD